MFLNIDEIKGQISACIGIYSHKPTDYENMEKLHGMLTETVSDVGKAIKTGDEEQLSVLLDMLEYQKKRVDELRSKKDYMDRIRRRGKYSIKKGK